MNEAEKWLLTTIVDHKERYKNLPAERIPKLYWDSKFIFDLSRDLEDKGYLTLEYGQCQSCKNRCGHVFMLITPAGHKALEV